MKSKPSGTRRNSVEDSFDCGESVDLTSVIAEFPHNDDFPNQIPVKKLIETFESCANASSLKLDASLGSIASSVQNDGGMKVYLRVRPIKATETTISVENEFSIVTTAPECSKRALYTKMESRNYIFTRVFDQHSQQSDVFDHTTMPLMKKFLSGDNCVLFAYGMTNAGKTHTVQGTTAHPGVLPRLVSSIIENPDFQPSTWELHISMLEIYQDSIYDLLGKRREKLNIRDFNGKVEVAKLSYHQISSPQEAVKMMDTAAVKRTKSSTLLNTGSSRSHAVYTLTLSRPSVDGKDVVVSQFQLVDLAGAERGSRTKATTAQQKEANQINMSLMQLWRCLQAVKRKNTDLNGSMEVIPFRESKLTHLLMPILSRAGMSGVAMIACVNPQVDDYDETITILGNASLASKIREFADVGRVAAHTQAPPSHWQTSSLTASNNLSTALSSTANNAVAGGAAAAAAAAVEKSKVAAAVSKIEEKDKVVGAGAKRKRHDSVVATAPTRVLRKQTSATVAAAGNSAKNSLDVAPDLSQSKDSQEQQDGRVESERKRLRTEVAQLNETNEQLLAQTLAREAEIRAEVSQEMMSRSTHLLLQIQELRCKLNKYELQQVNDVTKSVRKVSKKQWEAAQDEMSRDLQEAEDEIERLKAEHEIELFKLKTENKKLATELAHVKQQLATHQIETGPSRLKKVNSAVKPTVAHSMSDQENAGSQTHYVTGSAQKPGLELSQPPSVGRLPRQGSLAIVEIPPQQLLEKKNSHSPTRSPLSALSSSQMNSASPQQMRSLSPLKSQHHDAFMQNKSPINLSALAEVSRSNSVSTLNNSFENNANNNFQPMAVNAEQTPYFKKLRSHFGRA